MKLLYSRKPGASLLEQIMVLGVILFIIAFTAPRIMRYMDRLNEDKTKLIMSEIQSAISMYSNDVGHAPTHEEGGLRALIVRPKGPAGADWRGSYMQGKKEIPLDSNKEEFHYASPPRKFKSSYKKYELYSEGGDPAVDKSNDLRTGD